MRLILLAAVAVLMFAPPATAAKNGKYLQNCPLANTGQVDPMVSPGGVADHFHAEFGAKAWSATSTTADLLNGPSTCFIPGNHAAYWVTCFEDTDGTPICPTYTDGYYGAFGSDEQVQTMPVGLRFIVGNSHSTTLQPANILFWRCDAAGQPALSAPPTTCPAGLGVELTFYGPKYWDGMNLDSPNHQSHVSYVKDATHQVRIPMLQWQFHYPPAAVGKFLGSDHGIGPKGRSAHFDVWEAQDSMMQAELNKCVNDPARSLPSSPLCGKFTSSTAPWIRPLVDWTNHVSYVKPDGTAAGSP
jgi:hypothetical protein